MLVPFFWGRIRSFSFRVFSNFISPFSPQSAEVQLHSFRTPHRQNADSKTPAVAPSEKELVQLHTRLIRIKHRFGRAAAQLHECVCFAARLEDVSNNLGSRLRQFRRGPLPGELREEEEAEEERCGWLRAVRSNLVQSEAVAALEW